MDSNSFSRPPAFAVDCSFDKSLLNSFMNLPILSFSSSYSFKLTEFTLRSNSRLTSHSEGKTSPQKFLSPAKIPVHLPELCFLLIMELNQMNWCI